MHVKVDPRVKTLIENGVKMRHRTMFVVVGDKFRHLVGSIVLLIYLSIYRTPSVIDTGNV